MGSSEAKVVTIGLVAVPETTPGVLYGLQEILALAGRPWADITGRPAAGTRIEPRIVSEDGELFRSVAGAPILPDAAFDASKKLDLALAPDIALRPGFDPRGRWPAATAWLRDQYEQGATVCSVCTGSILLAETGLLDGLEATSHWGAVPLFKECYPEVRLKPEKLLTLSGAGHRIITSGGYASWTELALYLIARFCGEEEALRTAKFFLLGDLTEGQMPFAAMVRPRRHDDATIALCQLWVAENYASSGPVAAMVELSGLTPRTFERRFRSATGYTPLDYVQTLRVEEAKQLLETTTYPTDQIGAQVGYDDAAFFRRLFKRRTGVTPARYRRRFRSIGGMLSGDA